MPSTSPTQRVALAITSERLRTRVSEALKDFHVTVLDDPPAVLAEDPPADVDAFLVGGRQLMNAERKDLRALASASEGRPVLVLAERADDEVVRRVLSAGAAGVVREDDVERSLTAALRAVLAGLACFPGDVQAPSTKTVLTNREKQILGMVVLGMSNADIARRLHLTESTIKSHLSVAYGKLGVRSRNEAAAAILDPQEGLGMGILHISENS